MKNSAKLLNAMLLAAPLLAGGCANPTWMPTGYTYEHGLYKAPPGAEVKHKWTRDNNCLPGQKGGSSAGISESTTLSGMPDAGAGAGPWQAAADDLVARLLQDFGRPVEGTWIEPESGAPRLGGLEQALQGSLTGHQVKVVANPGDGPFTLHYNVQMQAGDKPTLTIRLTVSKDEKPFSESGVYHGGDASMPPASMSGDTGAGMMSTTTTESTTSTTMDTPPLLKEPDAESDDNAPIRLTPPHVNE